MSRGSRGRVYRPTYTHKGEKRAGRIWWADYSIGGRRVRESTGETTRREALDFLHRRLAERGSGPTLRELERVTFADLEKLITADYEKNGRKSAARLGQALAHLRAAFESWRAVDIGEAAIDRYAADRLGDGAAPATVNRELAALRRMLNLGRRARMVGRVPVFAMLRERNVRTGFVEDGEFSALRDALPEHLRPLAEVAFVTGWRRSELLSRGWRHVDFDAGWLRLEPGETKNDEGRQFPLIPRLRAVLEAQRARAREVERRTGRIVGALFFRTEDPRAGQPLREFKRAWATATKKAGVPGLLFHDFRRTAVRNLIRAGVPEQVAMRLTGHLTRSIFDRYAIVDEGMLLEGAERLAAHLQQAEPDRKVLPLPRG